jgi:hypothetical protein
MVHNQVVILDEKYFHAEYMDEQCPYRANLLERDDMANLLPTLPASNI